MGVNKVVFGAVSIMDISDSTVTEDTLAEGVTAYGANGDKITGKMKAASDPVLQAKTVTPTTSQQAVTPDSGYDGLSKVTVNAMPTATQATPSITVSTAGLITASATQSAGYVASGTKSATKQLTVQAAKTVTPTTSNQTAVASGRYTTGAITVKGDANLKAENIKSGVSIFGVAGAHSGSATPTGTLNITVNGTYDVTNYASASVNVASSGGGATAVSVPMLIKGAALKVYYTQTTSGGIASNTTTNTGSLIMFNSVHGSTLCVRLDELITGETLTGVELVDAFGDCRVYKITSTGTRATIQYTK